MARSPYNGFTTRYRERYQNKRIGQCTNALGDTCCPKCGETRKLSFVDEHTQMGFHYNKYFEFMHCESADCGFRFCIVMLREEDYHGS